MTQIQKENILSYSGNISFEKINNLLNIYKTDIELFDIDFAVKKRLFSVIVESLENAYRHNIDSIGNEKYNNININVNCNSNEISIRVSNYTLTKSANKARIKIDEINLLNLVEIKKLYKKSIASAKISTAGGAGLGIIEIAKHSRQKIRYKITDIKDDISHFEISTTILNTHK